MKSFLIVIAFVSFFLALIIGLLIGIVWHDTGYSPALIIVGIPNIIKLLAIGGVLLWLAKEPQ